jgi:4a-hydroxytetrahydrobiopterin dehydratase
MTMEPWKESNGALERTFRFESFPDAITWMFACSLEMEPVAHYPQWTNVSDKVMVRLTTDGTVTPEDRQLAAILDENFVLLTSGKSSPESDGE